MEFKFHLYRSLTNKKNIKDEKSQKLNRLNERVILLIFCSSSTLIAVMLLLVLTTVTQAQPTKRSVGFTIPCQLSPLALKLKLLSVWMGTQDMSQAYCRSRRILSGWKDQVSY
jgi:hypothetical protein